VKQALRSHTDAAVARGVFGVPTLELPPAPGATAPRLFFGDDALEMAAACLQGDPWFGAGWEAAAHRPVGVQRPR
jgi:2-hydroxychromene-2-carboxylate isomerase